MKNKLGRYLTIYFVIFALVVGFVSFAAVRSYQEGYAAGECDALGGLSVEDGWGYACIEKLR